MSAIHCGLIKKSGAEGFLVNNRPSIGPWFDQALDSAYSMNWAT